MEWEQPRRKCPPVSVECCALPIHSFRKHAIELGARRFGLDIISITDQELLLGSLGLLSRTVCSMAFVVRAVWSVGDSHEWTRLAKKPAYPAVVS